VQAEGPAIVRRRLAASLGLDVAAVDPGTLDYATRLIPITQEMEERLAATEAARERRRLVRDRVGLVVSWLSPPVAVEHALADIAGTGRARHEAFLQETRAFQLSLREFMYPRVLRPVTDGGADRCPDCPGRLTFTEFESIPRFTPHESSTAARLTAPATTVAVLLGLILALAAVAFRRAAAWRAVD
jgi:ABC-2 type transport system permease protein